jgi:flagellar hook-associated protein 3 FlgL
MPSSVQIYSQAITNFKRLQSELNVRQSQMGADSKSQTFADLGDNITSVQSYKFSIDRSDRFINSIKDATRKNDVISQSIKNLIDQATQFKQNLTIENSSGTKNVNNLAQQANSSLDSIRAALNNKYGNNYLFAGSKTDQEPVKNLTDLTNIIDGGYTALYYKGDEFKSAVDVSSAQRVEYGITASDPTFQKLIGAINLAKDQETQGTGDYKQAGKMLDEAISDLIAMQSKIGDNGKILANNQDYHEKAKSSFEEKVSELDAPDIVQLTVETSKYQAALQASFSAFSKIQGLSLINFL